MNPPRSKPLCRWSAADVGLDCKQVRDPLQRLLRQWRPGVDMHVVNFATRVTPACNLDQTRRGALGINFIKAFEASVAIGMQKPTTPPQQRFGLFRFAVARVAIEGCWWC